jgi:hypothetical protein
VWQLPLSRSRILFHLMSSPRRPSPTRKTEPESWLLRLFESEFFDSRLALTYLFRYPDNVGIHHYICQELKKFPEDEIEFLLPQICHIMLSRPNDSAALEEFVMDRCQHSNHMAILVNEIDVDDVVFRILFE